MGAYDIIMSWISPLTDPMRGFELHAQNMNSIHSTAVQQFTTNAQGLQTNTIASGQFADAITNSAQDFTNVVYGLSAMADTANKLDGITEEFTTTVSRLLAAGERAAAALEGESALTEITADVDVAAVAEAGANPIADVAAIILTLIDGALLIETMKELGQEVHDSVQSLIRNLWEIYYAVYPPVPPAPTPMVRPPSWASKPVDPNQLRNLVIKYGYLAQTPAEKMQLENIMKGLLQKGLTPEQIEGMMTDLTATKSSNQQILTFLNGLVRVDPLNPDSPSGTQILNFFNSTKSRTNYSLTRFVQQYSEIAGIPGSDRLLERLITSMPAKGDAIQDDNSAKGYNYEWDWVVAHKDNIARIEDVTASANGKKNEQAADIVMKSGLFTQGAVVDVKSYSWTKFDALLNQQRPLTDSELYAKMQATIRQIKRDNQIYNQTLITDASGNPLDSNGNPTTDPKKYTYKNNDHQFPIVYCFDSHGGKDNVPQKVVDMLSQQGVTVMSSPPDKVYQPSPAVQDAINAQKARQQQAANQQIQGRNDKIGALEGAERVVNRLRQIVTGGSGVPQLPGPGDTPLPLPGGE
ncbi:hypothetical protein [Dictyobacter aurantiacus]|uniref:Uncharacterized protein n=1 Tax=Dictyobacter aurantiacus TaxID=1936993 RepID=A0A401ZF27_9CHLR|nr:hypothetical protein [Dictyobacter aurantiacus]GCE05490.1 hypothetical protein KDAU_28190 [Dictyobacter aurantiacus]